NDQGTFEIKDLPAGTYVTQSEFERLITFSRVGFKSIFLDVIFALGFTWICLNLMSRVLIPGLSSLFAQVFILLGLLCAKSDVLLFW
ncbi:MAG: hypothetical protein AAB968_03375, partial [Patescibacteria group bacterium]